MKFETKQEWQDWATYISHGATDQDAEGFRAQADVCRRFAEGAKPYDPIAAGKLFAQAETYVSLANATDAVRDHLKTRVETEPRRNSWRVP